MYVKEYAHISKKSSNFLENLSLLPGKFVHSFMLFLEYDLRNVRKVLRKYEIHCQLKYKGYNNYYKVGEGKNVLNGIKHQMQKEKLRYKTSSI